MAQGEISTLFFLFLVIGMLVTGTLNTIAAKVQNETESVGQDGVLRPFQHPW